MQRHCLRRTKTCDHTALQLLALHIFASSSLHLHPRALHMSTTLLTNKITQIPPRMSWSHGSTLVSRPHLISRLFCPALRRWSRSCPCGLYRSRCGQTGANLYFQMTRTRVKSDDENWVLPASRGQKKDTSPTYNVSQNQ